jgi:signal peptidase I
MLVLAVLAVLAGSAGCGAASAVSGADRYRQGGGSMEPTVKAGQVINVRKVGHGYTPRHGDIVLFHGTEKWSASPASEVFLKRVVAVGGEVIACCDSAGLVTVDDSPLDEPYVKDNSPLDAAPAPGTCLARKFDPVTVPPDMVFLMGDNRMASNDSRCEGPVPASSVFAVMTG